MVEGNKAIRDCKRERMLKDWSANIGRKAKFDVLFRLFNITYQSLSTLLLNQMLEQMRQAYIAVLNS